MPGPSVSSPFAPARRFLAKVRRRARLALSGESPRCFFDIDDSDLVSRVMGEPLAMSPRELAFELGDRALGEKLYELREDLRMVFPLGLTPMQRGDLLNWFCRYGWPEMNLKAADVLRVLFEQGATPDRGLVATYLVQPGWQGKWPDALTPSGWEPFKNSLAAEFKIRSRWFTRAALPPRFHSIKPLQAGELGVNAIGLFRYTSGLQQAAQSVVDALESGGVRVALRDVPMAHNRDGRSRIGFDDLERFPITIINTGLDLSVPEVYRQAGLHRRAGVYRIAAWFWELEQLPEAWLGRGAEVDEIWAPTSFIAESLRVLGKPVFPMLPAVRLPKFEAKSKAACGLDPKKFTFLFTFDMNSRLPRKNPIALIDAFRLAFAKSEPVELAIKTSPQERHYPEWWRELRSAVAMHDVKLIDRSLPRGDLLALMNAADAYVSLHRSEGLGLTMAEAMLLGKPTIATGYSGNLDFMTAENSYLVAHGMSRIEDDIPPYPKGCVWAEPSIEDAARQMRRVYDHPEERAAIAARGRADAERTLSVEASAERMIARLKQVQSTEQARR
jgi:glycosyltransferase involved in cell wall biosynthesis